MKIEATVAALTVTAVDTFASVVAVATADGDGNGGQNKVGMKVSCNKEGGGDGGKSNDDKGGGQATAMATKWAMGTETRLVGNKEGRCKGGKGNGDGNEGRQRQRQQLKQDQRWQRQQQWLWRWQTTTEMRGLARINKMRQAAAVAAETAAVAAVIVAARLQRQAGVVAWRK